MASGGRESVLVIALGGITCSFKSTLARNVKEMITKEYKNVSIKVMHQDDYYLPVEQVPPAPDLNHYNYECPESARLDDLVSDLERSIDQSVQSNGKTVIDQSVQSEGKTVIDESVQSSGKTVIDQSVQSSGKTVIILDGILVYCLESLRRLFDRRYFIHGSYDECKRIRSTRKDYVPPDVEGYFDAYVWPYAKRYEEEARRLAKEAPVTFLDMNQFDLNLRTISMDVRKWLDRNWILLKDDQLDLQLISQFVTEPADGAVAIFCGTTRDTFEGKKVVQLEYEAYQDMAYSEMSKLCGLVRQKWTDVDRIAVHHRLGIVPVTESSVIIAVSSPHRKAAQEACAFVIDHLKAKVPIWKKEVYADGTKTWKENAESAPKNS